LELFSSRWKKVLEFHFYSYDTAPMQTQLRKARKTGKVHVDADRHSRLTNAAHLLRRSMKSIVDEALDDWQATHRDEIRAAAKQIGRHV
jgi:hypothetical protein